MSEIDPHINEPSPRRRQDQEAPAFPSGKWDRYEFLGFLGEGGMGRVFKAYDLKLERKVALKILIMENPKKIARFQNEALAQARIEHPSICKVYDVGEENGHFYISMQFIQGQHLGEIIPDLNLEQKIILFRKITWAVHEAHRAGLIHRDLKPGNILVEEKANGELHPFILDFGLAKELNVSRLTVTGAILGTPHYMAPEQVRGETQELDRRTDVYSLGVTLYELLFGTVPFEGTSYFELAIQVQMDTPKLLNVKSSSIPRDLQIIIGKCMMKEKNQRYQSAKELAEDLTRYLNGDPILARPASTLYRLKKFIGKHKTLVSITVFSFLLIISASSWGILTKIQARKREALIQDFSERIMTMDSLARFSNMLPPHDTQKDLKLIQNQISSCQEFIQELGTIAMGPGHYAQGRGYLALENIKEAKDHFEQAWMAGYQEPRVAYALGLAYTTLYRNKLNNLSFLSEKNETRAQIEKIEKEYRDPAIFFLQRAEFVESVPAHYLRALLEYLNQNYQHALAHTQKVHESLSWFHEAYGLDGDIYKAMGIRWGKRGNPNEQARYFEMANAAYQKMLEIAPSDMSGYIKMIGLLQVEIVFAINTNEISRDAIFQQAIANFELAEKIQPQNINLILHKMNFLSSMGELVWRTAGNPGPYWTKAILMGEGALKADHTTQETMEIYVALLDAYEAFFNYNREYGKPFRLFRENIDRLIQEAEGLDSQHAGLMRVSVDYYTHLAISELFAGQDPTLEIQKAIDLGTQLTDRFPENSSYFTRLGYAQFYKGRHESMTGKDPVQSFKDTMASYQSAISVNPGNIQAYSNLGETAWILAEVELNRGLDPRPTLNLAARFLKEGIQKKDDLNTLYDGLATTYLLLGTYDLEVGLNPGENLKPAIQGYKKSLEISPKNANALTNIAECFWIQARYEWCMGQDPREQVKSASDYYLQSLEIHPEYFYSLSHWADVCILQAEFEQANGLDSRATVEKALDLIDRSLKSNQKDFWGSLVKSKVLMAKANLVKGPENLLNKALDSIDASISINPRYAESYVIKARIMKELHQATGSSEAWLEQAANDVEKALGNKTNYAEAMLLKAELLLEQSKLPENKDSRINFKSGAIQLIEKAKVLKPSLISQINRLKLAEKDALKL